MNDIKYNGPCVGLSFNVQKSEIDGVKHYRQRFEENQEKHQIMNLINLKNKDSFLIIPKVKITVVSLRRRTPSQTKVAKKKRNDTTP